MCPSTPLVSVIMAAADEDLSAGSAVRSLLGQTFLDWELLWVHDGSTGNGTDSLKVRASIIESDPRIRRIPCNGPWSRAAGCNVGLRHAKASLIAYVDVCDELYTAHLDHVARLVNRSDLLIFDYDLVLTQDDGDDEIVDVWDSSCLKRDLFFMSGDSTLPLGFAHRREIALRIGGFNDMLWWDVDGDFLKRMARAGSTFLFSRCKSGRRRISQTRRDGVPFPSLRQRARAEVNYHARRPLHEDADRAIAAARRVRKVVYASVHSIIDFSSGAAVASLDVLRALTAMGFRMSSVLRIDAGL